MDGPALLLGAALMIFDPILDLFRGKAVTIPPLDGALQPNTALDEAEVVLKAKAPDNLCFDGRRLLFSSATQVFELAGTAVTPAATYEVAVTALAASPSGKLATALDDGRILVGTQQVVMPQGAACPTALTFGDDNTLYICQGSAHHRPSDWVSDLMAKNATGSVWRIDLPKGSATCLASNLAFPFGVLVAADKQGLIISESWRHRLLRLPVTGGAPVPVLSKLPGYPARLAPAAGGGAWLTLFAPRNRLIEFVLQEKEYRLAMMREVPREYWIAPALSSGGNFLEPLQCGSIKTMGIHKPWSPSRSYGLVARLDAAMQPVTSFHSRASGRHHGVTSAVEAGGRVLVTARGGGAILSIGNISAGEA
jgi:Strictosidine synthase